MAVLLLVLCGKRLTADLLGLVIVLFWRFWICLHVSAVEAAKKKHKELFFPPLLKRELSKCTTQQFL